MDTLLSNTEIPLLDFIQLGAEFLLLIALFWGLKTKRRFWLNLMLAVFGLQCLLFILFRENHGVKLFAGLMLILSFAARALTKRKGTQMVPLMEQKTRDNWYN
jgi:hypothetical protein